MHPRRVHCIDVAGGYRDQRVRAATLRGTADACRSGVPLEEQMRRCRVLVVAVSVAAVWGSGVRAAWAVPAAGSWGKAVEVPGLRALNTGGGAVVVSVSCGSAGSCAAGGWYAARHRGQRGFVAVERNGRWRKAIEVPGLAALNTGGNAVVTSVSCASAGSCAAGGSYRDRRGDRQGFVAVERNGRWRKAIEVPGLAALNTGGNAVVTSVSCGSAGSCAAGGSYRDRRGDRQGFVAVQRNGRWRKAIGVPGLPALNKAGNAVVTSVSCGSAGSCAAGGSYRSGHGRRGFVADERHGRWRRAIEFPGLDVLNTGRNAGVTSVSCASAGSCASGGDYTEGDVNAQGFVADEDNGVWGTAIEVPGLAALNTGGFVQVLSVSCGAAGSCAVGGDYTRGNSRNLSLQGFVADEDNGVWSAAIEVPGLAALNTGGGAVVVSVSCGSASSCAAGGEYTDRHQKGHGFVAVKRP